MSTAKKLDRAGYQKRKRRREEAIMFFRRQARANPGPVGLIGDYIASELTKIQHGGLAEHLKDQAFTDCIERIKKHGPR